MLAVDQIDDSFSSPVIVRGRDHVLRLVEQIDDLLFFFIQKNTVNADLITFLSLSTQLAYDRPVDRDSALADQLFGFSS